MTGSSSKHFLTTLLILLFIICSIKTSSAAGRNTNTEFIKSSCKATNFPQLCITSLSIRANAIQNSPKLLANTALSVTLATAKTTSTMMTRLSQSQGLKPREVAAMKDCVEEMTDSVDQLQRSLGEMNQIKGSSNFELIISDVQTWVSAALTDEDMCTEGFAGNAMNGNMKNVVRGRVLNIVHLTSNALALINNYASLNGYVTRRK